MMKHQLTLALLGSFLIGLAGCERETTSVSYGSFNVDGNTGLATGEALGINFEVAGATGVQTRAMLQAGKAEDTSTRTEITLADDAIIQLEMVEGGNPITFRLNGRSCGELEKGDNVVIDEDRNVTVNGAAREVQ